MCGRIGVTAYGLSPPTAWDLTPEQTSNNGKLMRHLIKERLAYSSANQQLLTLCWGLACAYQATVQPSQRAVVKAWPQSMLTVVVLPKQNLCILCEEIRSWSARKGVLWVAPSTGKVKPICGIAFAQEPGSIW